MKQLDSEMNRRRSLEEGEDRGQDIVACVKDNAKAKRRGDVVSPLGDTWLAANFEVFHGCRLATAGLDGGSGRGRRVLEQRLLRSGNSGYWISI
jgi:hypothetical protein